MQRIRDQVPSSASADLVESARRVIATYDLIAEGETILLALSGGKDSLLLALVLAELGVDCRPVVIDMGYEDGWANRVTTAAASAGVPTEVIDVRALDQSRSASDRGFLARNLRALDADSSLNTFTPCTYCYNTKVISLETFAQEAGVEKVAFGHHFTDACASMLKEALMYVDRWDRGNERYSRARFSRVVDELAAECRTLPSAGPLLARVTKLVEEGVVDSDEPPRQPLREGSQVEIVRPFFEVPEERIVREKVRLELPTEPSGCGHGATAETETSREMVHRTVLREAGGDQLNARLGKLLLRTLLPEGSGRAQARRRRSELLGPGYKPVVEGLQKL